jgi:hypothetical protein
MGYWQDSPVYYRDFGYPNSLRRLLSMAQDVGDTSAKTFAEYVGHSLVAHDAQCHRVLYLIVTYAKHA